MATTKRGRGSDRGAVYRTDRHGWAFDVYVGPRQVRKRRRGFTTRREAAAAAEAERSRYADVNDPTVLDLGTYLGEWVEQRAATDQIRETTAASYRWIVAQVAEALGTIRLDRLTAAHLDRYYHQQSTSGGRTGAGLSARTVRYYHTVIRKALADAVRKGMIPSNVADAADPPSAAAAKAPEPKVWTAEEARAFLSAAWIPEYRRVGWQLAFGTGMRRGELAGLLWSDVDGDQLHIRRTRTLVDGRLVEGKPKTAKGYRTITISPELAAVLRRWRSSQVEVMMRAGIRCDHVLTDEESKPWHPDAMSKQWARDAAQAAAEGLVSKPMRLHDCRHWNATELLGNGIGANTVSDRLGHASPAFTLAVYGHSDQERDRQAAATIAGVLGG